MMILLVLVELVGSSSPRNSPSRLLLLLMLPRDELGIVVLLEGLCPDVLQANRC